MKCSVHHRPLTFDLVARRLARPRFVSRSSHYSVSRVGRRGVRLTTGGGVEILSDDVVTNNPGTIQLMTLLDCYKVSKMSRGSQSWIAYDPWVKYARPMNGSRRGYISESLSLETAEPQFTVSPNSMVSTEVVAGLERNLSVETSSAVSVRSVP